MGSILTPILFQTFLNDPFLCLTKSDLHNAADGNVISVTQQPLEMFCKKVVFKKLKEKFYNFFFAKLTGKHLCRTLLLTKLQARVNFANF